jgi:PAS domain S-box-containing protein
MRSDAIIAADREGIIHFWNSGAGRLFGYSPDEAISRSLDFIIPAGKTFPHSGQSDAKLPRFNRKMERKWLI